MPHISFACYAAYAFLAMINLMAVSFFTGEPNFFHPNYIFFVNMVLIAAVLLTGIYRSPSIKSLILGKFALIDLLFLLDMFYNIAAISYSQCYDLSVREAVFQITYFLIYFSARVIFSFDPIKIRDHFKFLSIISVFFWLRLFYATFIEVRSLSYDGRMHYMLLHPNITATMLIISMLPAIFFLASERGRKISKPVMMLNLFFVFLCGFFIFLTASRGAIAGFCFALTAAAFTYWIQYPKKANGNKLFFYGLISAAVLVFTLSATMPHYFEKIKSLFQSDTITSLANRSSIWSASLQLFRDNPWFGIGPNAFIGGIQKYSFWAIDAHNFILDKLCGVGIFGTILYLLPLSLIVRSFYRSIKTGAFERNETAATMNIVLISMLAGVFTNSSFSPHYSLPMISFFIYSIFGMYLSALQRPDRKTGTEPEDNSSRAFPAPELVNAYLWSAAASILAYAVVSCFDQPFFREIAPWIPSTFFNLAVFFYFMKFNPSLNETAVSRPEVPTDKKAGAPKHIVYISLSLAAAVSFTFIIWGHYYFVAARANRLGISAMNDYRKMDSAENHFNTAVANEPGNFVFLTNKSYAILLSYLMKNKADEGASRMNEALAASKKCLDIIIIDDSLQNNFDLMDRIYKKKRDGGPSPADAAKSLADSYLNPETMFSRFVEIYGEKAPEEFAKYNQTRLAEIYNIMKTKDYKAMERYIQYIVITLYACINLDIPNVDQYLIYCINQSSQATSKTQKVLPAINYDYKTRSREYLNENLILSKMIYVMPLIWRQVKKLDNNAIIQKLEELSKTTSVDEKILFPVMDKYLFGNDSAEIAIKEYHPQFKNTPEDLDAFASGDYDSIIKNNAKFIETPAELTNDILRILSWAHYKKGDIVSARRLLYFLVIRNLESARNFDIQYKNLYRDDALFNFKISEFEYLNLDAYYNSAILLALVKLHKGDFKMALPEIFEYANKVIYAK